MPRLSSNARVRTIAAKYINQALLFAAFLAKVLSPLLHGEKGENLLPLGNKTAGATQALSAWVLRDSANQRLTNLTTCCILAPGSERAHLRHA